VYRSLSPPPSSSSSSSSPIGFDEEKLEEIKRSFIEENAGRAFEFMVDDTDEERKSLGMGLIGDNHRGE